MQVFRGDQVPDVNTHHSSDFNELVPQYAVCHAVGHTSWSGSEHKPLLHGEAIESGVYVSAQNALIWGDCNGVIQAEGHPRLVPSSVCLDAIPVNMMFGKHLVLKHVKGLVVELGHLVHGESDGSQHRGAFR